MPPPEGPPPTCQAMEEAPTAPLTPPLAGHSAGSGALLWIAVAGALALGAMAVAWKLLSRPRPVEAW